MTTDDLAWAFEMLALVSVSIGVFYGAYRFLRWLVPGWGTILVNVIAGLGVLIENLQLVPWQHVMSSKQQSIIIFGLFVANILVRITKADPQVPMPKLMGKELEIK